MAKYCKGGLKDMGGQLEELHKLRENWRKLKNRIQLFLATRYTVQRPPPVEIKQEPVSVGCWYFKTIFRKRGPVSVGCRYFETFFRKHPQEIRKLRSGKYRLANDKVREVRNREKKAPLLKLFKKLNMYRRLREGEKDESKELIALDLLQISYATE